MYKIQYKYMIIHAQSDSSILKKYTPTYTSKEQNIIHLLSEDLAPADAGQRHHHAHLASSRWVIERTVLWFVSPGCLLNHLLPE